VSAGASIAAQIGARRPERRDAKTMASAKSAVILAIGRTLSGSPSAVMKALLNTPGVAMPGGLSLVFGTERRTSALDAAMLNAVAAAAGSGTAIAAVHSAGVVSLFALCEARATTGEAFLDAFVFGAEMAAAYMPADDSLESAVFGNVVAATRLLALSPAQIAAALALSADGVRGAQGTPSPLAIGFGLKQGLLAALLAETMDDASCGEMAGAVDSTIAAHADGLAEPTTYSLDNMPGVQLPPGADLWDQFERQASAVLPRNHIAPLFERLETIDKVTDLATVSRLLQGRGTPAPPQRIVFAPRGAHEPEETTWVP
jgi:hypothetical protein